VYPEPLVLARLRKDALRESAYGLTRLVLLSARGTGEALNVESSGDECSGNCFWSYCETAEEISLILSEVWNAKSMQVNLNSTDSSFSSCH
jgi:hypothetical protein